MVHCASMTDQSVKLPECEVTAWGHYLYARKCIGVEGIIILPDKTKEQCDWEEVLAIGHRVGKPREWTKARLTNEDMPRRVIHDIEVGDILLCPDYAPKRIQHSPFSDKEFLLDESIMLVKWLGGDDYLPLGNRVLVETEKFDKDAGGIELPDSAEGLPTKATVVKLGTGICNHSNNPIPFDVVVGDEVLLPFEQFKEIKCSNGKRYQIVEADKIEAVL
jgi:co-chaperonin GroES (HSP10)